jgi:choline-sulfatase
MPVQPTNLIVILSDEHNPKVAGYAGHPIVQTPNLDRLAARGTRFSSAYTNCPICVPGRASLATGRHVHEHRCWDNAIAYEGAPPSWGHRTMAAGHRTVSIGKLHYQDSDPRRNGFDEEILPMHIVNGVGDLLGLIRDELPKRVGAMKLGPEAGPGESDYTRYDRDIVTATRKWLREEAPKHKDRPWVLYVGFVAPHFPLIAPQAFYDLYPPASLPWPKMYAKEERPKHPFIDQQRWSMCFDDGFTGDDMVRRALAGYFGLTSFLDDNIGQVLGAVEELGLWSNTRVLYSSDHGDNLGARGLWGKSTMYEESAGIPMLLAGPGIPEGAQVDAPVSLVDVFQTTLDSLGVPAHADDADLPGHSLIAMANGARPERTVLSEYHAAASPSGSFMIRHGRYKYIHYAAFRDFVPPPMLFDLEADPEETVDLAGDPAHADVRAQCLAALMKIVDPQAADALARADQQVYIDRHGGRDAILGLGTFRYTPPPGVDPQYFAKKP